MPSSQSQSDDIYDGEGQGYWCGDCLQPGEETEDDAAERRIRDMDEAAARLSEIECKYCGTKEFELWIEIPYVRVGCVREDEDGNDAGCEGCIYADSPNDAVDLFIKHRALEHQQS